jgi:hypothetical protein
LERLLLGVVSAGFGGVPNRVEMASRRAAASASMEARTPSALPASSGLDLIEAMWASMAERISSVMVLPRS